MLLCVKIGRNGGVWRHKAGRNGNIAFVLAGGLCGPVLLLSQIMQNFKKMMSDRKFACALIGYYFFGIRLDFPSSPVLFSSKQREALLALSKSSCWSVVFIYGIGLRALRRISLVVLSLHVHLRCTWFPS